MEHDSMCYSKLTSVSKSDFDNRNPSNENAVMPNHKWPHTQKSLYVTTIRI